MEIIDDFDAMYEDAENRAKSAANLYIKRVFTKEYCLNQCTYDSVWEKFLDFIIDEIAYPYELSYEDVCNDEILFDICLKYTRYVVFNFVKKLEKYTGKKYEMPYEINSNDYGYKRKN